MKYTWEESDIKPGLMFYCGDKINHIFELKKTGYILVGVYSNDNYVFSINEVVEYLNNNKCVPI